jgi:L-serine/L-threonine ammonia-lyase
LRQARSVVVILCGGVGVTAGQLAQWSAQFAA